MLAREGWRGAGDLILCAVADEEVGAGVGLSWLVEAHPDLVRADYVVNEGGGERIEHNGRVAYSVGVGEKRCSAFAITVRGKSGHASAPGAADNALAEARPGDRADRSAWPARSPSCPRCTRSWRRSARRAPTPPSSSPAAGPRPRFWPRCSSRCWGRRSRRPMPRPRTAVNIIPGRARLACDCRILPGMTQDQIEQAVRAALAGIEHEFEFVENVGGTLLAGGHAALSRRSRTSCPRSSPARRWPRS